MRPGKPQRLRITARATLEESSQELRIHISYPDLLFSSHLLNPNLLNWSRPEQIIWLLCFYRTVMLTCKLMLFIWVHPELVHKCKDLVTNMENKLWEFRKSKKLPAFKKHHVIFLVQSGHSSVRIKRWWKLSCSSTPSIPAKKTLMHNWKNKTS